MDLLINKLPSYKQGYRLVGCLFCDLNNNKITIFDILSQIETWINPFPHGLFSLTFCVNFYGLKRVKTVKKNKLKEFINITLGLKKLRTLQSMAMRI